MVHCGEHRPQLCLSRLLGHGPRLAHDGGRIPSSRRMCRPSCFTSAPIDQGQAHGVSGPSVASRRKGDLVEDRREERINYYTSPISQPLAHSLDSAAAEREAMGFSLPEMRSVFNKIATMLHLDKWRPVLYMGRHSGASLDRLTEAISLQEVQKRGRWRTETSVRRYEKRALVQEVYLSLPHHVRQQAHRCEAEIERFLLRLVSLRSASRKATTGTSLSSSSFSLAVKNSQERCDDDTFAAKLST